jgi:hypothetical protein
MCLGEYNASMSDIPRRAWFRFSLRTLFALLTLAAVPAWFVYQHRMKYPHGPDHCCDKQLYLALLNYADVNGGKFPSGGKTPEASLSLLYSTFADAAVLRGKTYPEEPAAKLLTAGKPLTPETCGWHYVDGIPPAASRGSNVYGRLALFWDKFGSGHNAELLPGGGHTVTFVNGTTRIINESDWARFWKAQEAAMAEIRQGKVPAEPWLPNNGDW